MQLFDLPKQEIQEIFKSKMPRIDWPAGAFDYQMKIYMELSQEQKDTLCEWLCENCTENFYVCERSSTRLAGGSSNNKLDWKQRNHPGKNKKWDRHSHLEIRLSAKDITLFRLVWAAAN